MLLNVDCRPHERSPSACLPQEIVGDIPNVHAQPAGGSPTHSSGIQVARHFGNFTVVRDLLNMPAWIGNENVDGEINKEIDGENNLMPPESLHGNGHQGAEACNPDGIVMLTIPSGNVLEEASIEQVIQLYEDYLQEGI